MLSINTFITKLLHEHHREVHKLNGSSLISLFRPTPLPWGHLSTMCGFSVHTITCTHFLLLWLEVIIVIVKRQRAHILEGGSLTSFPLIGCWSGTPGLQFPYLYSGDDNNTYLKRLWALRTIQAYWKYSINVCYSTWSFYA